jgi:dienelactone hydrolase
MTAPAAIQRVGQVVTICGSTRFRDDITAVNRELTLAGYIVLAPGVFVHDGDPVSDADKARLDRLHLAKIDLADWVYVVNPGGYVGDSTRREIEYATTIGKAVWFLTEARS